MDPEHILSGIHIFGLRNERKDVKIYWDVSVNSNSVDSFITDHLARELNYKFFRAPTTIRLNNRYVIDECCVVNIVHKDIDNKVDYIFWNVFHILPSFIVNLQSDIIVGSDTAKFWGLDILDQKLVITDSRIADSFRVSNVDATIAKFQKIE